MITIIDYDTGNLRSVANALGRLGAEYRITADAGRDSSGRTGPASGRRRGFQRDGQAT